MSQQFLLFFTEIEISNSCPFLLNWKSVFLALFYWNWDQQFLPFFTEIKISNYCLFLLKLKSAIFAIYHSNIGYSRGRTYYLHLITLKGKEIIEHLLNKDKLGSGSYICIIILQKLIKLLFSLKYPRNG